MNRSQEQESSQPISIKSGSWAAWKVALRPMSLPMAMGPVLVGSALAWVQAGGGPAARAICTMPEGSSFWLDRIAGSTEMLVLAALSVLVALLMQVITNLQNDVGYTLRGAEGKASRTGLPRATAMAYLGTSEVRRMIVILSIAALTLGVFLYFWRGVPVLWMGFASLIAALAYMGGPWPIAYGPFGELTVIAFFGLVAVLGTDWLVSASWGWTPSLIGILSALSVGCLAAAALAVNNHRDCEHDALVGRRTFVVLRGKRASQMLYAFLLLFPFAAISAVAVWQRTAWLLLVMVWLVPAIRLVRDMRQCPGGLAYNQILFRTFGLELKFSATLMLALLLGGG